MTLMYVCLLCSYAAYIYFRVRFTLKTAKDQRDRSANAQYVISVYSIFTLCIELLCMAAMSLFAGKPPLPDQAAQIPNLAQAFCKASTICLAREL